jgi:uncharacterized protein YndB with AHSA1/START domain
MMNTDSGVPIVETQMLIRKPVRLVFQAFVDPEITTSFWFTKASGKLEAGETVVWEWEMYGVSTEVFVKEIIPDKRISIVWGNPKTTVDFEFSAISNNATYLVIRANGFTQTGEELVQVLKDNTGGFTTLLDGAKAFLEYGIKLNLVADKFPKEVTEPRK